MSINSALTLCALLTLAWGIHNPHKSIHPHKKHLIATQSGKKLAEKKQEIQKQKIEKPDAVLEIKAETETVVEPEAKPEAVVEPEVVTQAEVSETIAQPEGVAEPEVTVESPILSVFGDFPTDNLTAFGSVLIPNELPTSLIGIGFEECGTDILGKVLASNPRTVSGHSPDKDYFNSKRGGKCNRKNAKKGNTTFQQYVNGCFEGKLPKKGETLIDISGSYSLFAFSGLVSDLKSMENETTLRFLAVVCDPRERALRAMRTNSGNESSEVNYADLSRLAAHTMRVHRGSGFSDTIAAGEYAKMLDEWKKHFPQSSLLIINSKALRVTETWKRILMHAGLEVPPEGNLKKWLRRPLSMKPKKREFRKLSHTVQKRFHNHYNTSDLALWRMTGAEWW
jgi:hypothetical protein